MSNPWESFELLLDKNKRPIPQLWDDQQQKFVPYTPTVASGSNSGGNTGGNSGGTTSSTPTYVAKEPFSGSANTTHTFTQSMSGFIISNDGASDLTFTIGTDTYTVKAGEVFEDLFDSFTQVTINSTVAFRAYGKLALGTVVVTPPSDTTAPTVTASPNGGTYVSNQSLTLTANETADIFYTLDGSTPTTSSTKYTAPISISATTTVKYFGKDTAGNSSAVQTVSFTITPADTTPPTITASPTAGTFSSAQTVTLTANEQSAIYYTLDGSTPTTSSTVYSSPLTINNTSTLKYFGKDVAGNSSTVQSQTYTITVPDTTPPTVTASPNGGLFATTQNVTLSANEAATIYYTTDNSTPTTSSPVYSAAIPISATTTLKFFGKDTAGNSSTVQTISFTIDTVAPTVTASPNGGLFNATQSVTLTPSETATVYYTTDGSTPTTSSSVYSAPISVAATTTLKFFAKDTAGNLGTVQTVTFTIDTVAPTVNISPAAGTYTSAQTVTLSSEAGATIYYTVDGSTPTTSSTVYSTPISVSATETIKYFAVDTAGNSSAVQSATYTINAGSLNLTDSFTGADGTNLSGRALDTGGKTWAVDAGTFTITSNQAKGTAASSFAVVDAGVSNCTVQAKMVTAKSVNYTNLAVRYTDANNHYLVQYLSNNLIQMYKKVAGGSYVSITVTMGNGVTLTTTDNDVLKVTMSGSNFTFFINGNQVATATDSALTGTKHGLCAGAANCIYDDFSITTP